MLPLPLIVGFGGVNCAGRSSFHHGYGRLTAAVLPAETVARSYRSLAQLMGLDADAGLQALRPRIDAGTLIRQLEPECFNSESLFWHHHFQPADEAPLSFVAARDSLPKRLPADWMLKTLDDDRVQVSIARPQAIVVPSVYTAKVKAAGQLPTGFNPGRGYASHHQPRGLQMTVFGASDALQSIGIDWERIRTHVKPEQIAVYASSAMGQLDDCGSGGMLNARRWGRLPTSRQCALGFAQMPADFINAYLLGNIGLTRSNLGACASFLYNLQLAVQDIQAGRVRVAVVGTSEAPITAEIMEGYAAMGALASDEALLALDGKRGLSKPDYRRASRPFGDNCGFVIAESAQFIVLFDDALALELGATIHGAVDNVFVHADGFKRSISAPGVGNYITVARALASARALLGEEAIQQRSFVQAHGSSTPQNRVSESHLLDQAAKAFGIKHWPVTAMKSYLGHSLGSAAGDQITTTLGVWAHGWLPGILTVDQLAEDVHTQHLAIQLQHCEVGREGMDIAIINAKGFGGNNASASLLAPHAALRLLQRRHGSQALRAYHSRNEAVLHASATYEQAILDGRDQPIYHFGEGVRTGDAVQMNADSLHIDGYAPIRFDRRSIYEDLSVG